MGGSLCKKEGNSLDPSDESKMPQPLGEAIADLDRKELCDLVVRLCDLIQQEVGTGSYRGGVFPGNITRGEDGSVSLGPAAEGNWQGQERDFLAPELFWHGQKSPAADVYSLGLLLYYAVNSARLPFYKSGENGARQRRMNGEAITPPKAAGRRLGEIIIKATAFQVTARYQSVEELKAALLSCVSNIYLTGPVSAENLYHKKEEDLSSVERMMLDILRKEEDPEIVKNDIDDEEVPQEPVVGPLMEEEKEPVPQPEAETPAPQDEEPIVILTEDKNPELEPVVLKTPPQYQNSAERERKIATKVRRRRMRPFVIILIVCALLLAAAWIYDHIQLRALQEQLNNPAPTQALQQEPLDLPDIETAPTAEPTQQPAPAETPAPTEATKESRYELITSDVSWTAARDSALSAGGHLVVINDAEEYQKVLNLAKDSNISYVWLGCRRVDGAMTWVDNAEVDYWPWQPGEPTYVDGEVAEDYLMLSNVDGYWGYNDNRNDPAGDYPAFYSGRIAYVIEFEN